MKIKSINFRGNEMFSLIAGLFAIAFVSSCSKGGDSNVGPKKVTPKTQSQLLVGDIWKTTEVDATLADGSTVKYTDTTGFSSLLFAQFKCIPTVGDDSQGTLEIEYFPLGGLYQNLNGQLLMSMNKSSLATVANINSISATELDIETVNNVDQNGVVSVGIAYTPNAGAAKVQCTKIIQIMHH